VLAVNANHDSLWCLLLSSAVSRDGPLNDASDRVAVVRRIDHNRLDRRSRAADLTRAAAVAAWSGDRGEWQIPYGALVPKTRVENVLASGRCISADLRAADAIRVIPICWITGHAAGVAAAVAIQDNCPVRAVDVAKVQKILKEQDAYLG